MPSSLFRSEAVQASAESHLGESLWDPIVLSSRNYWIAALPAMLVLFIAPFYKFPQYVMATGYVRPVGGVEVLHAPRSGVVSNVYVSTGQSVSPQQRIIDLDYGGISATEQERLETELEHLRRRQYLVEQAVKKERDTLSSQREAVKQLDRVTRETLRLQREDSVRVREQEDLVMRERARDLELLENGFLSPAAVNSRAIDRLVALDVPKTRELQSKSSRRTELNDHQRGEESITETLRRIEQHEMALAEIRHGIVQASLSRHDMLTSPTTSGVAQLLVVSGQSVVAGDAIAVLSSRTVQTDFEIYLAADYAERIKTGQVALVTILSSTSNSPSDVPQRPIEANIVEFSRNLVESSILKTPVSVSDHVAVGRAHSKEALPSGQPLSVRVYIGSWSLYEWLISPIFQKYRL